MYTQIDAAGAEVARSAASKDHVAKLGPEASIADVVPDALNSPTLVNLRAQYATLARESASQPRTLLPQHPPKLELRAELAETHAQLRAKLNRIRAAVSASYAQAAGNLSWLQAQARDVTSSKNDSNEAQAKLRQLESAGQAIRAVFEASLHRTREREQLGKIETNDSRIISQAMPPARSSKLPLPIVLGTAALFGTCLGTALAFLLERLPHRAAEAGMTAGDAARFLGLDGVVALPRLTGFGEAAEACRP